MRLSKDRRLVITRIHDSYKAVFDSPDGQRVMKHLCKHFNVTNPKFSTDPYLTAFKEGQRHVVMSILKYVNKDQSVLINQIEADSEE